MTHKFKVGQTVRYWAGPGTSRAYSGEYKVVARLPESNGECQYRIQGSSSGPQRVCWESQLSAEDVPGRP
jgi:hypothetical protein